ncbi:hypothetical protein HMPREF3039_02165 [Akkermansia sp. KLE1798]|nr:hypothetical protein HMPREF3039_02165 [Akkermansia sp. KLE1798]
MGPIMFSFKYCCSRYVFNVLFPFKVCNVFILEGAKGPFHSIKCCPDGAAGKIRLGKIAQDVPGTLLKTTGNAGKSRHGYLQGKRMASP